MLIPKTAGCGVLGDWAKQNGCFIPWTGTAQPGDLVLFDFKGTHKWRDHVGIVAAQTGDTLSTIEGNTSVTSDDNGGAVMRRTRYVSQVTGYVRPKWTDALTAQKALAIAAAEVGVKESPAGSNNVKYNTWYYGRTVSGSAYPWCCAFAAWVFAALAGETGIEKEETCMAAAKMLRAGSQGSAVKKLQILLTGLGYDVGRWGADGDFGPNTLDAVKRYQSANGLAADGVVGTQTWTSLIG